MVDITVKELKENVINFQNDLKILFNTFEDANKMKIIDCTINRDNRIEDNDKIISIDLVTTL